MHTGDLKAIGISFCSHVYAGLLIADDNDRPWLNIQDMSGLPLPAGLLIKKDPSILRLGLVEA